MNAFARSNLAVASLRLMEAQNKLAALANRPQKNDADVCALFREIGAAGWAVREALRLIDAATALDELESVDTLPSPPDSGARRVG